MALISYIGGDSDSDEGGGTLSFAAPAEVQADDVLVVCIVGRDTLSAASAPAGWTQSAATQHSAGADDMTVTTLTRVATSSDAGATLSPFDAQTPDESAGALLVYRGATLPINVSGGQGGTTDGSGSTDMIAPSVTTTVDECRVVTVVGAGFINAPWSDPSGTTLRQARAAFSDHARLHAWDFTQAIAGATGTKTSTSSDDVGGMWVAQHVALRPSNLPPNDPAVVTPNGGETFDATETISWTDNGDPDGDSLVFDIDLSTDNGGSWSRIKTGVSGTSTTYDFSGEPSTTSALVRIRARDPDGLTSAWDESDGNFTIQHNTAPNAPTQTNPVGGATIDRSTTERFTWTFDDPDAGDSPSAYDLQIRDQGTGTVEVDVSATSTNSYHDLPGGTLGADGEYEWRVRTYDALGVVGPWSSWEPFAAATPPDPPTITDPTSGQTIGSEEYVVKWSAPSQAAYQLRRVADDAGSPNTAEVYADTGTVETTTDRDRVVAFPTNDRWEHVQIRIRHDGLWSTWASVRVQVSYTVPATPLLTVTPRPGDGDVEVAWTNPTPGAGEPSVTSMRIYRTLPGADELLIATATPSGSPYLDRTAPPRTEATYRVVAVGDNGTSSTSADASATLTLSGTWIHPADDPDALRQYRRNGTGGERTRRAEQAITRYVGRERPTVEYGDGTDEELSVELALVEQAELDDVWSLERQVVCVRDAAGRRLFATVSQVGEEPTFYGWVVDLALVAVDHDESVSA